MGKYMCYVCDDKAACRAIDEALGEGGTGAYISRLMTFRGFPVSAEVILGHKQHAVRAVPPGVAVTKKDFARLVRDKAEELFEKGSLDLTDKDHVPGINVGLKAQAEINKQANKTDDKKTIIQLAMILSGATGGGPPPHLVIGDGLTIEGDFEELDDDDLPG